MDSTPLSPAPTTIVSRHHTAGGIVTWERSASRQLQAVFLPDGAATDQSQVVTSSRPR